MRADQVAALIRAHAENDHPRFRALALAIAAHMEKQSPRWARSIREAAGREVQQMTMLPQYNGLMSMVMPTTTLADMVLEDGTRGVLADILMQHRRRDELDEASLRPDRRLLFCGPPGVGKSMAAAAIAGELAMPMIRVHLHGVIASHLGESSANLAKVFEMIRSRPAVYLFDEFDALAGARGGSETDVGEMRRVVNSLLTLIETDESSSIIIGTTNLATIIDGAMFRRFDDVLSFALPDESQAVRVIKSRLIWPENPEYPINFTDLGNEAKGVSHSDLVSAVGRAQKYALLNGRKYVSTSSLLVEIDRRRRKQS